MDETFVYLWVTGLGDKVDTLTSRINLSPTKVKSGYWELHAPLPKSVHIDDQLEALLDVLEPKSDVIRLISQEFETGINAAVYYREDLSPGIHLSKKIIDRLARMNLSIDFDLYFLGSSSDD